MSSFVFACKYYMTQRPFSQFRYWPLGYLTFSQMLRQTNWITFSECETDCFLLILNNYEHTLNGTINNSQSFSVLLQHNLLQEVLPAHNHQVLQQFLDQSNNMKYNNSITISSGISQVFLNWALLNNKGIFCLSTLPYLRKWCDTDPLQNSITHCYYLLLTRSCSVG